ncbi:HAD family hydrolase [Rhodococcus sp. NPDC055112]
MPLLLLDLDNTLVNRSAAFRRWSSSFVRTIGQHEREVEWLMSEDQDGYAPRDRLAQSIIRRYGLPRTVESIVETLLMDHVAEIAPEPGVVEALGRAIRTGWTPVVVTNGVTRQQEAKLRTTGLSRYLGGCVISEEVGIKKPDRRIFERAGELVGMHLGGGWMVGDHPVADIVGAHQAGLSTAWVTHGRQWPVEGFQPTLSTSTCSDAIGAIVGSPVRST